MRRQNIYNFAVTPAPKGQTGANTLIPIENVECGPNSKPLTVIKSKTIHKLKEIETFNKQSIVYTYVKFPGTDYDEAFFLEFKNNGELLKRIQKLPKAPQRSTWAGYIKMGIWFKPKPNSKKRKSNHLPNNNSIRRRRGNDNNIINHQNNNGRDFEIENKEDIDPQEQQQNPQRRQRVISRATKQKREEKNNRDDIDVRKHKLSDSAPVIMCSGLKEHQIDDYNNFKSKFSTVATFTTSWKNNVTHLVTAVSIKRDKSKLYARTIKYFQTVIAGAWVVCFDWIKECLSKNTLVNESKYEVVADKHGAGACKKSRELRKKNLNDAGLFANIICVVASEFQYVKLDEDLRGIFRIGGASIRKILPYQWLKDIEKYKKEMNGKKLIFVYDKEQTEMTPKQLDFVQRFGVLTMAYQQVFDAISNYTPI